MNKNEFNIDFSKAFQLLIGENSLNGISVSEQFSQID